MLLRRRERERRTSKEGIQVEGTVITKAQKYEMQVLRSFGSVESKFMEEAS